MSISIAIAGTTERTVQCAQSLQSNSAFDLNFVVTPIPKPVGRKKILTPTPLETFARTNNIPVIHIDKKITTETQKLVTSYDQPDILLVIDFGYIVPSWLLELPKIAPINIHPSNLPKWRGSSPGQFAILFNEKKTAVSVMVLDEQLDHGPIITKKTFSIESDWTQKEYYEHAFSLICEDLDTILIELVKNFNKNKSLSDITTPQPDKSPTLTARQLQKSDAYIPWKVIKSAQNGIIPDSLKKSLSQILFDACMHNKSLSLTLERASKAFSPWPELWTTVETKAGETRMKLLKLNTQKNPNYSYDDKSSDPHLLVIETVHLAGKQPADWQQVKTGIQNS